MFFENYLFRACVYVCVSVSRSRSQQLIRDDSKPTSIFDAIVTGVTMASDRALIFFSSF